MCDALSRNVPKLPAGVETLLANCLAHYLDSDVIQSGSREYAALPFDGQWRDGVHEPIRKAGLQAGSGLQSGEPNSEYHTGAITTDHLDFQDHLRSGLLRNEFSCEQNPVHIIAKGNKLTDLVNGQPVFPYWGKESSSEVVI
jgi:hypothetical protein